MNLLKILVVILIASITSSLCAFAQEKEKVVQESRDVDVFFQLLVSGQYEIILQSGTAAGISLEGPVSAMDAVHVEVKAGTLMLYSTRTLPPDLRMKAIITYVDLRKMKLAGDLLISHDSVCKTPSLQLDVSGNTKLQLQLETSELVIQGSGAVLLDISGTAQNLTCEMSGTASLRAYDLQTTSANMLLSGSARGEISASDQLVVALSGNVLLTYDGSPVITEKITGNAKLQKRVKE